MVKADCEYCIHSSLEDNVPTCYCEKSTKYLGRNVAPCEHYENRKGLEPWQARLYDELAELYYRIQKLEDFLDSPRKDASPEQILPMIRQLEAMHTYAACLEERIALFSNNESKED